MRVWRVRPSRSTARASRRGYRAYGRRWRGDAGDWPGAGLYHRHGVEMTGVRYAKDRLPGFSEVGDRGAEARYDKETDQRILAAARRCAAGRLRKLDRAADRQEAWRRSRAICLAFPGGAEDRLVGGRKSWCQSNDPEFAAKAAEIVVGLYMAPPDHAIVLAVDEKPSIQALERAQGYLKLPNGRAITGQLPLGQTPWDDDAVCCPRTWRVAKSVGRQ